jgi:hypothetical protein
VDAVIELLHFLGILGAVLAGWAAATLFLWWRDR